MRQFSLLAVTALVLAGLTGWIAARNQSEAGAPTYAVSIYPVLLTTTGHDLPTQHIVDYSLVYE
jgi:hypothetical protein